MAKRHAHRVRHHKAVRHSRGAANENYLVVVRGWMLVVAFALMLGLGAMIGQFINTQLNASTPTVAGVSTGN